MRLLDYNDLSQATGISVATLRVWNQRGKLPAPVMRKGNVPLWSDSLAVRRWIEEVADGVRADSAG